MTSKVPVDVQQGLPERGDGRTTVVDATWGMNFDDERGNVAVSLSLNQIPAFFTEIETGLAITESLRPARALIHLLTQMPPGGS